MKNFRLIDNLMGWLTFAVAAFTYCSTVEPTASFWDCPEFITTAFKLEVGHPPGAPFFMLTGNLFTQFVNDPAQVAYMVNIMSALFSALCILFLFWSISHLARKLVGDDGRVTTLAQCITVEASALTGALIYCFSDTFWFSAVEGEVYAYSSLFTAVVFWVMLKWEDHADEPGSDRYLILIAYLTGLSIGVHLLNLLCLPALVLIFYYKKTREATLKGSLIALGISFLLVAAVLYGVVPGIVKVGGWFELLFVNTLDCPFNTGLVVYIALLTAVILWAIWETHQEKSRLRMNLSYLLSVGLLGIPFYSYGLTSVIVGVIVLGLLYVLLNHRDGNNRHRVTPRIMNTSLLCMLMLMIGYSSYAVIVIRSTANTPMDQNSPEDIFTLGQYLGREQYGDRPLFYGQAYNSQVELRPEGNYCVPVSTKGAPVWQRKEKKSADEPDRYEIQRYNIDYVYGQNMLFPRMYSDRHAQAYEDWLGGVKGHEVPFDRCGEKMMVKMPTQLENLRFFVSYQLNFMYWRYFMWNFAGRQNDLQGNGEPEHGNWLTGIPFIDNMRLGDQSLMPSDLKNNKGHNVFYCLPLLLGLIGFFWQVYRKDRRAGADLVPEGVKQFWVVFFLFFMTGLAIVIYLNQTPMQPRERDYAYAGSFYAFAIWCGLGVAGLIELLSRAVKNERLAAALGCLCVLVPLQMVSQTWDDHDRSGRYTCRDFGQNYLMSLPESGHPIIFTNGDNDTFPLWYCQETEGIRTDARVCNLSYLQTDWYIDQMKRPAYDSPSVPISWKRIDYVSGTREGIPVRPGLLEQVLDYYKDQPEMLRELVGDNPYELSNIISHWILSDDPDMQVFPTDSMIITVDKEAVRRSGMMMAGDSIPDVMPISLKGKRAVYKSEMMIYEMLARCNWERPIFVALTVGSDNYGHLGRNFVQEGLANRITPWDTNETGRDIDVDRMYDNLMHKFRFGGIDRPGIYLDETVMRMCWTHRRLFATLAEALMERGDKERALEVVRRAEEAVPAVNVPHNYNSGSIELASVWALSGESETADRICCAIATSCVEYLEWYSHMSPHMQKLSSREIMMAIYHLDRVLDVMNVYNGPRLNAFEEKLSSYNRLFQTLY